ncbi:MAG TPA: ABC transporter permease [Candidatus Babeliales bacterium]|nr:ABC transporter permease [Candidatus Babeliales bacterium]
MNVLKRFWLPTTVLGLYLFLYVPIIIMLIFSFNNNQLGYYWTGFTLEWYQQLFQAQELWFALKNTLVIAFASVFLSLTFGLMIVYSFGKKLDKFFSIFYLSAMVPEIVIAVGLLSIFSWLVIPLGLNTLIIGHTLLGLGFVVPILHARYAEMDSRLLEASADLGASTAQTFFKVILPFLYPALVSAAMLVFIISLDDFLIAFFCAGPKSQTLSLYIFALIRSGVSPVVNALSMFMLMVSTLLVLLFSYVTKKSSGEML